MDDRMQNMEEVTMEHKAIRSSLGHLMAFLCILVLIGISCNAPGEGGNTDDSAPMLGSGATQAPAATATITPTPEVDFLAVDAAPRDPEKIIILAIEPDQDGNIRKVSLNIPDRLVSADAYANGERVQSSMIGGTQVTYELSDQAASSTLELVFEASGERLAICTITLDDALNPEGDCTW